MVMNSNIAKFRINSIIIFRKKDWCHGPTSSPQRNSRVKIFRTSLDTTSLNYSAAENRLAR